MAKIYECPVCLSGEIDEKDRFCHQCHSDIELFRLIEKTNDQSKKIKRILYPLVVFLIALSATFITLTLTSPAEKHNRKISNAEINIYKKITDSLSIKVSDLYKQLADFQNQINTSQAELMQSKSELESFQTKKIPKQKTVVENLKIVPEKEVEKVAKKETKIETKIETKKEEVKLTQNILPPSQKTEKKEEKPSIQKEREAKDYTNFNLTDLKDYMKKQNKSTSTIIDTSLLKKMSPTPSGTTNNKLKPEAEVQPLKDKKISEPVKKKEESSW